jgi:hypothetical protein
MHNTTVLAVRPADFDVDAALAALAREGFARLGQLFSDESIATLGQRLEDILLERVRYDGMFFQLDSASGRYEDLSFGLGWQGPSLRYRKIEKLELDPLFRAVIENPLFERIARAHIGDEIALYRAVVFNKAADGGGTALPWHQDGGVFWGIDRAPTLQIWTALDDAPVEAGCVEVVPGTHKSGLATPQGGVIPSEIAPERGELIPARAGESLLIHNHVWHRSGVNSSGRRRAALSICYMSADTRCLRRRRSPRRFLKLFQPES